MTRIIPGIGGTLLPDRYIARHLLADIRRPAPASAAAGLRRCWNEVSARLGPTTPVRALFDEVAMPLVRWLGFSAHDVIFDGQRCRARLQTPGRAHVALLVTPWASRPPTRWAEVARHASDVGAKWGFVLSPPFLSVVAALGSATRESIDVHLPLVLDADAPLFAALAHATRFDQTRPGGTTLDDIVGRAAAYRDRVRADLQVGVEASLRELVPAITRIGAASRSQARGRPKNTLDSPTAADEALTVVFRILFLLFAESRRLVPTDAPVYAGGYTIERLCREAAGGRAVGQWEALGATSRLLRMGCHTQDLRVEPFNGALFARSAAPGLERVRRARALRRHAGDDRDEALRRTLVALGSRPTTSGLEAIDYRDLGVEQLGAVYERVLDLDRAKPDASASGRRARHSRRRRETGTFYTPEPLAAFLVRRTLAPLVETRSSDQILELRVLDPAMGSGAFLVAACRYLAAALEQALVNEGRLSPEDLDEDERARLRRQVAERCLAGVDSNGTAVQLARLSLWLTTLARDRPLGFLDHHLRTGNSLVGAWPTDLARVSDTHRHRQAALPLFELSDLDRIVDATMLPLRQVFARPDNDVADVHAKEAAWRTFHSPRSPLHGWRRAADIWCARWFHDDAIEPPDASETRALISAVAHGDRTLRTDHVRRREADAARLADAHGFFHWPLEFPGEFLMRDADARPSRGFDAVVGNPPWEMVRRDDGERQANASHLLRYVRQSRQYPSCTTGHLNLYQAFVDRALALTRPGGRIGLVVPWGLATDDGAAGLRRRLIDSTALDLVVGLDNASGLFPIHRGVRMAIVTASTGRPTAHVRVVAGVRHAAELDALPERGVVAANADQLTPGDLRQWTGDLMRFPDLRRPGDLDLLRSMTSCHPRLGSPEGWAVSFGRELNATDVRDRLQSSSTNGLKVIEGKHLAPFRVYVNSARHLPAVAVEPAMAMRTCRPRVGYRDVSAVGNRFTLIAAIVPAGTVTTHTVFCVREPLPADQQHFLCACLNSYVLNAIVRLLMGSHVTTSLAERLPVPRWRGDRRDMAMAALARRLACEGRAPSGRRTAEIAATTAKLQGMCAVRFGLTRLAFSQVLEGFPLVPVRDRRAALDWFDRYS